MKFIIKLYVDLLYVSFPSERLHGFAPLAPLVVVEIDEEPRRGGRVEAVALVLPHGPRRLLLAAKVDEDDALGTAHGPQLAEALLLELEGIQWGLDWMKMQATWAIK